jgi:Uma2 family endonuclease
MAFGEPFMHPSCLHETSPALRGGLVLFRLFVNCAVDRRAFSGKLYFMQTAAPTMTRKTWTDEELETLPRNGHKYELLDGDLIMSPVYENHGAVCVEIITLIGVFVRRHKLGKVYDSSTGFRLTGDLLLSPDVSFVSNARLKRIRVAPEKFLAGAPDLVVEVLSPSDRMTQVIRKLDHYFEHGTKLAWLVNCRKQHVHTYTADSIEALTDLDAVLTGGAVLPGFKCKLRRIFLPG